MMARRHFILIQSNPSKNQVLDLLSHYLSHLQTVLCQEQICDEELACMEEDLEVVEEALKQLWVTLPFNEALYIPRILGHEDLVKIRKILTKARKLSRHLRIAHSEAA